ncbi:hypothetical protein [Synechococcus sp. N32]|uniref:hypothetical protein n=1 Tax=Synechococcus sp. N32 TaxID=2575514 RepID=UPI00148284ED|nr:hypothetical protein [Synechococcus sp. N32]
MKSYGSKITLYCNNEQLGSASIQSFGEKRMGMSKLKEKMAAKAAPSTPKQGRTKPWLY